MRIYRWLVDLCGVVELTQELFPLFMVEVESCFIWMEDLVVSTSGRNLFSRLKKFHSGEPFFSYL